VCKKGDKIVKTAKDFFAIREETVEPNGDDKNVHDVHDDFTMNVSSQETSWSGQIQQG
jgi:hypothetical protein